MSAARAGRARVVAHAVVTISPVIWNPANGWPFRTRVRRLTKARRRAVVSAVTRKVQR